jgi:hypothetical protein
MAFLGLVKDDPKKNIPAPKPQVQADDSSPKVTPTRGRRASVSDDDDSSSTSTSTSAGSPSKDLEKNLRKAIDLSGGDGFDFVKFMKFLKKQANLDEPVRYQAAIAAADAMSVSSDDLIKSGGDALKVLDSQSKKNDAEVAEKEEQNDNDQADLKKVDAQIAILQSKKETLEERIKETTQQISDDKANFEATVDLISGDIKDIISKIKKYSK